MKRFLTAFGVCLLFATVFTVASADLKYNEARVDENGNLWLEVGGMYEVGTNCSIPSGMYFVTSQGFGGKVFIPGDNVIFNEGTTLLQPVTETQSFRAESGTYVAGIDFPAGTYSIRSAGDSTSSIIVHDTAGGLIENAFLWEKKGKRVGKCEILEGYTISVGSGGCYFSAPGGITFE